jgi:acyl carrier protein
MEERRERVRAFVAELLRAKGDGDPFGDDTSLYIMSGRMDSLNVIDMVNFLETEFGLDLSGTDFSPESMDSVNSIIKLLETAGCS